MYVQIKHLQDLIPTLAGLFTYYKDTLENARECFIYTCIWLQGYVFVLTVANGGLCLCMIAIFNWLLVSFFFIAISTL